MAEIKMGEWMEVSERDNGMEISDSDTDSDAHMTDQNFEPVASASTLTNDEVLYVYQTMYGIERNRTAIKKIVPGTVPRIVTLKVGPLLIKSQTDGYVLYVQSSFFFNQLNGKKIDEIEIALPHLDPYAVDAIIKCLSSGKLEFFHKTPLGVNRVIMAASKFGLNEIAEISAKLLKKLMITHNMVGPSRWTYYPSTHDDDDKMTESSEWIECSVPFKRGRFEPY